MKKSMYFTIFMSAILFFSVSGVTAQDTKTDMKKMNKEMSMEQMQKSPHHKLMMAYRQNLITFTTSLQDAAKTGETLDAEFARTSVAEIRRSAEKMNEIHQKQMTMMSPEMRTDMAERMEKMQQHRAKVEEHIAVLERLVQAEKPDPKEIEIHSGMLVSEFAKMGMQDRMMDKKMKKDMN